MKAMCEYDEKTILDKSTFDELFSIENEFDMMDRTIALTERACDLGKQCGINFKKKWRAYKSQTEKERKERNKLSSDSMTEFDYFEDKHELNCGEWKAGRDGISKYGRLGIETACYHPILITQILKNVETGKQKVKLAFCVAGEWNEIVADKGTIASANKITKLAEYGINATSENARYLVKYLADLENLNIGRIERKISTSKFGWIRGDFIPYGMDVVFDGEGRFPELFESVAENGSYEKWLDCVKKVRASGRKEPMAYLAASFASVLLEQLDLPPFVLNLWQETGKGKTVSMMVAASVWGNPKVGKYVTDVSATGTGLEVRSDLLNHLPLFVDDLSKAKEAYRDAFTDLVYSWSSGKGKDRSNQELGLQKSCTWCNITMTSYERPLATENMRGGAVNRILDFMVEPGDIFTKEAGNETAGAVKKNYGFAGKLFVDAVKKIGTKRIKEIQQGYLRRIDEWCLQHGAEKEDKQKLPLSVILTGDELSREYIFRDGRRLDFEWCIRQLKGKDDVSENQRAYESIMDDVSIHVNNFNPDDDGNYKGEFWGGIKDGYVYIVPAAFERMADRYNFSSKAFLDWAKNHDMLLHDKGKNQKTAKLPPGTGARKFYAIRIKLEEEENTEKLDGNAQISDKGSEFVQYDGQIELPFEL